MKVLRRILNWRTNGKSEFCSQMNSNEFEASISKVLAIGIRIFAIIIINFIYGSYIFCFIFFFVLD